MAAATASGLIALLEEPSLELRAHALRSLNQVVDHFWFQVSSSISTIEGLFEDASFPDRELAALVAAKVFYHLGELDDALSYALGAGLHFDVSSPNEFEQTLLSKCMDQYIRLRVQQEDGAGEEPVEIDPRLVSIVERMLDRCIEDGQFEHAVGVALEARRLDVLRDAVSRSPEGPRLLEYTTQAAQNTVAHRGFRLKILELVESLHRAQPDPDWVALCRCHVLLNKPEATAAVCTDLLRRGDAEALVAYQVALNLFDAQVPAFSNRVASEVAKWAESGGSGGGDVAMEGEGLDAGVQERVAKLQLLLSGTRPVQLRLDFLFMRNQADLQILRNIKTSLEQRNSVCHSATVVANAFMHAGTSVDTFLRENIDWLERATNWARFSATASLGVIYQGMLDSAKRKLSPYLPSSLGGNARTPLSPYTEGGAYFAMGLLHAFQGSGARESLKQALRNSSGNETLQHGACLGLGLACLGTDDEEVGEDIKQVLYNDSAVAGEAAGVALGLLAVGTGSEKAAEMLAYAHDTQHEKIVRGLGLGLALIMFGREDFADVMIEQMTGDQDPIVRYAGMQTIGLAYVGTANPRAIQKLLHFGVSDVSHDVRRAALMHLGFVLCGQPERCPQVVALLSESYNPHARYGAAMAVGVACAGTGSREAQRLLEPLLKDPTDFVRQGARIATALVMIQQPEARVKEFREQTMTSIGSRHEEVMAKMGSIMALGILDAGGRNATVQLRSPQGHLRLLSLVGMACFLQYWYWYPMSHFLSLCLTPTGLVGLDASLRCPAFDADCACKPSAFAYPPPVSDSKTTDRQKVPTATLSVTAKAKRRQAKKEEERKADEAGPSAMEVDEAPKADGEQKKDEAPEPSSFALPNMSRVVPQQVKHVSLPDGSRWQPVRPGLLSGMLMLKDTRPGETYTCVDREPPKPPAPAQASTPAAAATTPAPATSQAAATPAQGAAGGGAAGGAAGEEPPPPAAFDYDPDA